MKARASFACDASALVFNPGMDARREPRQRAFRFYSTGIIVLLAPVFLAPLPAREPEKVRFVTAPSPPHVIVTPDGRVTGANVGLFTEAARRAGYAAEWIVTSGDPVEALLKGDADLFHAMPLDPAPPPALHVTRPWINSEYIALILQGNQATDVGLRVSMIDHPIDLTVQRRLFPNSNPIFRDTRKAALADVCQGRADAMIGSPRMVHVFARGRPPGCENKALEWIERPDTVIPVALAARPQFRREADKIYSEIAKMALGGDLDRVFASYGRGG